MNYSTAVFLINDRARAVLATYEAGDNAARTLFKTFDQTMKVGDFVTVPTNTRHKMTVVKVVEVDVDFDPDTTAEVQWIVGKVDTTIFEQTLAQEEAAISAIKSAELRAKRKRLREALLADQAETLRALPIASMGAGPAIEGPTKN